MEKQNRMRPTGIVVSVTGSSLLIEVPCAAPSLNELLRMNRHVYAELLRTWTLELRAARPATFSPLARFEAHVVRAVGQGQKLDLDNLAGSCKLPLDALRKSGFVVDDNPHALVKLTYEQVRCPPSGPTTLVTLTTLQDTDIPARPMNDIEDALQSEGYEWYRTEGAWVKELPSGRGTFTVLAEIEPAFEDYLPRTLAKMRVETHSFYAAIHCVTQDKIAKAEAILRLAYENDTSELP